MKTGEKIKVLRQIKGFRTQSDFWTLVNPKIWQSSMSRWENRDEEKDVPKRYLIKAAKILDVDPADLADPKVSVNDLVLSGAFINFNRPVLEIPSDKRKVPLLDAITNKEKSPREPGNFILLPDLDNFPNLPLKSFFCFRVGSPENAPKIEVGSLVFGYQGNPREILNNGVLALFHLGGKGFVRKVTIPFAPGSKNTKIKLEILSHNPEVKASFPPIDYAIGKKQGVAMVGRIFAVLQSV